MLIKHLMAKYLISYIYAITCCLAFMSVKNKGIYSTENEDVELKEVIFPFSYQPSTFIDVNSFNFHFCLTKKKKKNHRTL